jgi:hypothetical protein
MSHATVALTEVKIETRRVSLPAGCRRRRRSYGVLAGLCRGLLERARHDGASGGGAATIWSSECGQRRGTAAADTDERRGGATVG